jgi:hypothetical protein
MQHHQWERYQKLELIPKTVELGGNKPALGLGQAWKVLLNHLVHRMPPEKQTKYLEKCAELDETDFGEFRLFEQWQQFWSLVHQSWEIHLLPVRPEPQIWQGKGDNGKLYWFVYDPRTQQTSNWESEDEVRVWLEERFYND